MSPLPPGRRNVLLSTIDYLRDPYRHLLETARRYGDPFSLPSFLGKLVVTGDPAGVRTLFSADPDGYLAIGADLLGPVLGETNLILLSGERHRAMRKLQMPPFHGARMRAYGDLILRVAGEHIARWPRDRPFPVHHSMQEISLEMILQAVFGLEQRARAAKYTPASAAIFQRAKSSPETLVKFAPIIERVIGRWVRRAAYQLECRVAICRVGYVVDSGAEPPIWFTALPGEINELFPKMPFQTDKIETTKDALTGATLKQQWAYFSVPLAPDVEHPFEAAANGTTCGERVAALEKAFDEQREVERRQKEEWEAQRRQVAEMRVNPALTRRLEAAFRSIATDATGAPVGVWECRGASDCRWRGPARLLPRLWNARRIKEALATQDLSWKQLGSSSDHPLKENQEGDADLTVVVREGLKRDDAEAVGESASRR